MAGYIVTVDEDDVNDEAHLLSMAEKAHLATVMGDEARTGTNGVGSNGKARLQWLGKQWSRFRRLWGAAKFFLLALVLIYILCAIWIGVAVNFTLSLPDDLSSQDEEIPYGCIAGQDYTFGEQIPSCHYIGREVHSLMSRDKNSGKFVWDIQKNETQGLVTLSCKIENIDFVSETVSVRCQARIYGIYREHYSINTLSVPQGKNANSSLVVAFGEQQSKYRSGDVVMSFVVTSSFKSSRDIGMYPLMHGKVLLSTSAFWLEPNGSTHDAAFIWTLEEDVAPPYELGLLNQVEIARPHNRSLPTVFVYEAHLGLDVFCIGIAMILIIIVWVTVLLLSLKACAVTLLGENTRYDLLAACAALLFALPAMRGMMPGNPPLGILMDQCTILWQFNIVCALFLILLYNKPKPKKV